VIEAYITNLGKYNEGELRGEYLKLPATQEWLQTLLSWIGVDGVRYEEIFITDYKSEVDGLTRYLGEYESIDELNYLAALLEDMEEYELEHFTAALEYGEYTHSIKDLINLTQNLDSFEHYPDVHSEKDLGYYMIDELSMLKMPETVLMYFDYEAYGRDIAIDEGGKFTDNGYIASNHGSFIEHYSGRDDLPDEHKIFAFPPQKERSEQKPSIQQTIAAYNKQIAEDRRAAPVPARPQPAHGAR
jgi:antirestriction protein